MNLVLHSERLTLRPLEKDDEDLVVEMFTDPQVREFTGGIQDPDDIRRDMQLTTRRGGDGFIGIWCVADRQSGEKLGTLALLPIPVEKTSTDFSLVVPGEMPEGDIEIGFYFKRSAWGKGYATEASRRLLQAVFEESPLTEVVATFDPANSGSRNVLEKAGFIDRGVARSYGEDGPNYRITRDEWATSEDPDRPE